MPRTSVLPCDRKSVIVALQAAKCHGDAAVVLLNRDREGATILRLSDRGFSGPNRAFKGAFSLLTGILLLTIPLSAATDRITTSVQPNRTTILKNHQRPEATTQND